MSSGDEVYIPRVTQLDSIEFDKEIAQVLKTQVTNISKVTPGSFLDILEPEITALLKFYIWKISVHRMHSTFGQHLLNLKYEGTLPRCKSYAWCILSIIPSYLKDRLGPKLSSHKADAGFHMLYKIVQQLHIFVRVATLYNLLMFLRDGKYPTLLERVLRMRPVPASEQQRIVGYSFMTRELIWHTLIGNLLADIHFQCPACGFSSENSQAVAIAVNTNQSTLLP
ncbi:Peroxisome biogenesis factor 2 [Gryllus bimaculatus]|nr:Peroxisome biogenesis factor 2 [Gryllus bimaculatus]